MSKCDPSHSKDSCRDLGSLARPRLPSGDGLRPAHHQHRLGRGAAGCCAGVLRAEAPKRRGGVEGIFFCDPKEAGQALGGFKRAKKEENSLPVRLAARCEDVAVGRNQWYHFGVGAPHSLVYFSGDWDVHGGYGLLTHGHVPACNPPCP